MPFGRGERTRIRSRQYQRQAGRWNFPPDQTRAAHPARCQPLPADWLELVSFVARYYHAARRGGGARVASWPFVAPTASGRDEDPLLALPRRRRGGACAARQASRRSRRCALAAEPGPWRRSVIRARRVARQWANCCTVAGWDRARPRRAITKPARPLVNAREQAAAVDAIVGAGMRSSPGLAGVWRRQADRGSICALPRTRRAVQCADAGPGDRVDAAARRRVAQRFAAAKRGQILHSALADGARSRGFVQALSGRADIVLGTRLAVFRAPAPRRPDPGRRGHDASYKAAGGRALLGARRGGVARPPARDVPVVSSARRRPRWGNWSRPQGVMRCGLSRRAVAATLPAVALHRRAQDHRLDEGLGPALHVAITQRLERGEAGNLVFLSRRGYASGAVVSVLRLVSAAARIARPASWCTRRSPPALPSLRLRRSDPARLPGTRRPGHPALRPRRPAYRGRAWPSSFPRARVLARRS